MSEEDLQKLLEAAREDPSLQEKLKANDADPIAIAEAAGFIVTRAEWIRAQAAQIAELSDEELEQAAGGIILSDSDACWTQQYTCPTVGFACGQPEGKGEFPRS